MKHNTRISLKLFPPWVCLLLLLPLLTQCSTTYRVHNLTEHVTDLTRVFEGPYVQIQKDYKLKTNMLESLRGGGANFKIFPFNQMLEQHEELTQLNQKLLGQKSAIEKFYFMFRSLEKNKVEIPREDKDYQSVVDYKAFAENFESLTKDTINQYVSLSKSFSSLAQKSDIYYLYPLKFNQNLRHVNQRLKRVIVTKQRKVVRIKKLISELDPKLRQRKIKLLNEMNDLISKIQVESKVMDKVSKEVQKTLGPSAKIIVGPHLDSHNFLVNYRQKNSELKKLLSQLNQVEDRLLQ